MIFIIPRTPPPINNVTIIDHTVRLYKLWQEYLLQFPKTSRYSLGIKIDNLLLEIATLFFTASYAPKDPKLICLIQASKRLDTLKFLIKVAWEIKSLDNNRYAELSKKLDAIGKMLGGWQKQVEKQNPAPTAGK
ncbi:TPA: hypothetical protein DCY83_04735 [Candidatus Wolfebacteria bacterium]|nr:hypothetical protein [Candidatus Wolfebacteria bacterium]HBT74893.1 hypothetical protein [Candidatus Wolfebacteria bacterium]